jgi:hypothetical protein
MVAEHIGAATGIVGAEPAVFIESEHGCLTEGNQSAAARVGHESEDGIGCMAGGEAMEEVRLHVEAIAPEAGGGFRPRFD